MKLLKLVIVDDEPILLQGLIETYDWNQMGFEVVGTAQSGERAIEIIKETKPNVVLTDIRMKQITDGHGRDSKAGYRLPVYRAQCIS